MKDGVAKVIVIACEKSADYTYSSSVRRAERDQARRPAVERLDGRQNTLFEYLKCDGVWAASVRRKLLVTIYRYPSSTTPLSTKQPPPFYLDYVINHRLTLSVNKPVQQHGHCRNSTLR